MFLKSQCFNVFNVLIKVRIVFQPCISDLFTADFPFHFDNHKFCLLKKKKKKKNK